MDQSAHHYLIFNTVSGFCGVAWNSVGITRFQLPMKSADAAERRLLRRLSSAEPGAPTPEAGAAIAAAQRYFEGKETDFSGFKLDLRTRPKTIASGRVSRCDGVVPFWMEGVASYVEGRHLLVGDFYTFRIGVGIEFAADRQTGFRRGVRDQCDGDEHAGERRSTPSLGYVVEHAMLDLVPLRRPRRIMADLESQGCLIGELLERHLPEPKPGTVRTAAVGRDHQAGHRGIPIPTHPIQPKPNAV